MDLIEIPVDEEYMEDEHICFNCDNACGSNPTVSCMGSTPWKGEQVKFNNSCQEFTFWS